MTVKYKVVTGSYGLVGRDLTKAEAENLCRQARAVGKIVHMAIDEEATEHLNRLEGLTRQDLLNAAVDNAKAAIADLVNEGFESRDAINYVIASIKERING